MIRSPVEELVAAGRLPSEADADAAVVQRMQALLARIEHPVTDDEATLLINVFGPAEDSCFGLAWSLVHAVESAPGWPVWHVISSADGPWATLLRQRASNAGTAGAA